MDIQWSAKAANERLDRPAPRHRHLRRRDLLRHTIDRRQRAPTFRSRTRRPQTTWRTPAKVDWPTNGFELGGNGSFQLNRWAVGQFIWILAGRRQVFSQESSHFAQGGDQLIGVGVLGDILQ